MRVIALAASAGGLHAISRVLSALPRDLPAALLLVQHLAPRRRSMLAEILARCTALRVKEASEGDRVWPGTVYIAPPDRHLLANPDGSLSLSCSELVHFVRPSADLLFESVAANYRDRAIAVVLTGSGNDGAVGIKAIKARGGRVIAQNQATSACFGMPGAAARTGSVDMVLPLEAIAPTLDRLARCRDLNEST